VLYAVSIPDGYDPAKASPLILVLHPGGQRTPYYGAAFARRVVEPGLRQMKAIMIAPDCESRAWSDSACDTAAMSLIDSAMRSYTIDRKRVLVVGFSMGGHGTWHMAARHADLFTAAIPMAASTRSLTIDQLGRQPSYIIHSRADEVVPFEPAEQVARDLKKLGREVHFEAIDDLTHFDMVSYVDALREAGRWVASRWKH
jgi:predicted peptidase